LTSWGRWRLKADKGTVERAKRNAAAKAVENVKDGFVVGLGSGSTAAYAIEELGKKIKREKIAVLGVPTSHQAFTLAVQHGVVLTTLEEHPLLNLIIDGADQVDPSLDMIKGMGGALSREKVVALSSRKRLIVVDAGKQVRVLGENGHPVPVEVLPFAAPLVLQKIRQMGGRPAVREGGGKVGPVMTDNGNFIVDAVFGPIAEPTVLERSLKCLPGVVETGLFVGLADEVYVGKPSEVETLKRSRFSSKV